MPSNHRIIEVESRLEEIFSYIPNIKYSETSTAYPVKFNWGNDFELRAFLKTSKADGSKPYPLIWLVYPLTEKHHKNRVDLINATFILAVDTSVGALNKERSKTTYKNLLIPLLNYFREVLYRADIVNLVDDFTIVKFPNYTDEIVGKNVATDRWDAIKVTVNFSIIDTCLKQIKLP